MKLSELTTGQATDVLLRVAEMASKITSDKDVMNTIGQAIDIKEMNLNNRGVQGEVVRQWSDFIRFLITKHREDVFGILAAVNGVETAQIEEQPIMETLRQIEEIRDDETLTSFLSSFTRQEKSASSAQSSTVRVAFPAVES